MRTSQLSEWIIHPPSFTDQAYKEAKRGFIDFFASCFAAKNEEAVVKMLQIIEEPAVASVPIIGQDKLTSPLQAALINGFIGHVLDYDDVHEDVRGHPSTVIIPALLSALRFGRVTGKRLMEAYIVGVETMAYLGKVIGENHYEKGWHNTSTLGGIAAAAACSYLLNFSKEEMTVAIGFAATQASGLRAQFGTEAKPLHAGLAAQAGYQAVVFTKAGITGSKSVLDGQNGFLAIYGDGPVANRTELPTFGKPWKIVTPGLWFKQYPFCSAAHQGADAIRMMVDEHSFDLQDVEQITVVYPPAGDAALVHQRPRTGEEGRFSIEYVIALAIDHQPLTLESFTAKPIALKYSQFFDTITRSYSESIQASAQAVPKGRFTRIECILKSGEKLCRQVDLPKGAPKAPLSFHELEGKLRKSAPHCAEQLLMAIRQLQESKTVDSLLDVIR